MGRAGDPWRYRFVKRVADIVVSLLVVVVLFVPCLAVAAVIALQSKGRPFYTQERVGLDGRHFKLLKFRTMVADADNVERYFTSEQLAQWEKERKVDDDPRITAVGHFLRRTSIDELPQFLNVLVGQMSIVGPRPVVDAELDQYGDRVAEFCSRLPGITGWWQVEARNDADYSTGTRQELELYYIENASPALDVQIFLRTFGAMGRGTGR